MKKRRGWKPRWRQSWKIRSLGEEIPTSWQVLRDFWNTDQLASFARFLKYRPVGQFCEIFEIPTSWQVLRDFWNTDQLASFARFLKYRPVCLFFENFEIPTPADPRRTCAGHVSKHVYGQVSKHVSGQVSTLFRASRRFSLLQTLCARQYEKRIQQAELVGKIQQFILRNTLTRSCTPVSEFRPGDGENRSDDSPLWAFCVGPQWTICIFHSCSEIC